MSKIATVLEQKLRSDKANVTCCMRIRNQYLSIDIPAALEGKEDEMMCRWLMILLCVTCILVAGYSESQDLPREIQWSEDLDYLIERLQITHPNLYANISREAFLEYANQLKQRIPAASDVEMFFGIQELLARIKNTHTLCNSILFMSDNEALKAQSRFYPVMYFQDAEPSDYSMASTPDIYVPKISSDFRENRDPVMERIFTYDSYKHLKPDFRELMSKAYMDSGLDGFKRVYDSVKTTYVEHGFNMETLLYKDLDAWMGDNRRNDEDYVEYLKFIHNELPNSIAVCYDLAYWMNERGDQEEAKRLWEKCLALNPEHHHARWRLALMKLEETWKSGN